MASKGSPLAEFEAKPQPSLACSAGHFEMPLAPVQEIGVVSVSVQIHGMGVKAGGFAQ